MLARCVLTVWVAWLGGFGLAVVLTASAVWSTSPFIPLGLAALMLAVGLGASSRVASCCRRHGDMHSEECVTGLWLAESVRAMM